MHSSEHRCDPSIWTFTFCKGTRADSITQKPGGVCNHFLLMVLVRYHTTNTLFSHQRGRQALNHRSIETSFPSINKLQRSLERDLCLDHDYSLFVNTRKVQRAHTHTHQVRVVKGLTSGVAQNPHYDLKTLLCHLKIGPNRLDFRWREKREHVVDLASSAEIITYCSFPFVSVIVSLKAGDYTHISLVQYFRSLPLFFSDL